MNLPEESIITLTPREVILSVFAYKQIQKILEAEFVKFCTELGYPNRKIVLQIINLLVKRKFFKKDENEGKNLL